VHHILTAEQFTPDELGALFLSADNFRELDQNIANKQEVMRRHFGRLGITMFYEPSTRTRLSFEAAAAKLGISVLGTENAKEFSSAAKGETIEDTVRVLDYSDVIILRTDKTGEAMRAAAVSEVPIINGGDGKGEHPTQAVLDMYTIFREFGRLDNIDVTIMGDLKYGRTARSLAQLLAKYPGNHISFVSTPELQIGDDIKAILDESGTTFNETSEMYDVLREADVVYQTRLQLERHEGKKGKKGKKDKKISVGQSHFILDASALEVMKKDVIIMHPLPRNEELPISTDADPRASYFSQARNGLYVRMAMLDKIMTARP
jgi:aspartate carbamoyltransferase catalytic subunit